MRLDEFLNARSIANLQTVQFFWAPTTPRSPSKHDLLRLLRRQMLSPPRVRERFDSLDGPEREMLLTLLRCQGYEADVDTLLRRAFVDGSQATLLGLERQGFLHRADIKTPGGRTASRAAIPQELGDVLAQTLNLDLRDPAAMLSLERALDSQRPPPTEPIETLTEPAAIERRVAALSDPVLQHAARFALKWPAGILPFREFAPLGLGGPVPRADWRAALERAHLGTYGHLDLRELGFDEDGDCLVLYQELVQSHAAAQTRRDAPMEPMSACGIDFVVDLGTLADFLRTNPSRLTSSGRFFKGARNQLLRRTTCHTVFELADEDNTLALKLAVARRLGLVEARKDELLHASRAAAAWQARPLADQARSVLDALLGMGESAVPQHFRPLARVALDLLPTLPDDAWLLTQAFVSTVLSRYLMDLLERRPEARATPSENAGDAGDDSLPYPPTVEETVAHFAGPLLNALNCVGLIDLGRAGDHAVLRPTELVPFFLRGIQPPPPPPNRLLLVNPDGEVVLFPEGQSLELLHQLYGFCDHEKSEVTTHLRITRDSIQRAALRGVAPEHIIAVLRQHCRAPLPQVIEYSIRDWAASVHAAQVETLHVLEMPSEEMLDAALHLPEIAPLVVRRVSPTAVALATPELGPEAQAALAQLGIFLT